MKATILVARICAVALALLVTSSALADGFKRPESDIWLVRRDCTVDGCSFEQVDAEATTYGDGFSSIMQDTATGRDDGTFRMLLDGDSLYMWFQFEASDHCAGEFDQSAHTVDITLGSSLGGASVGNQTPSDGDRWRSLTYQQRTNEPGAELFFQTYVGDTSGGGLGGTWRPALPEDNVDFFEHTHKEVFGSSIRVTYEVRTTLRQEWLDDGEFLLGMKVDELGCLNYGQTFQFPNRAGDGVRVDPQSPSTWALVRLVEEPPTVSVTALTYNIGQMPSPVGDGGVGDVFEFGYLAAEFENVCMQETWEQDRRREIWETANMFREITSFGECDGWCYHPVGTALDPGLTVDRFLPDPEVLVASLVPGYSGVAIYLTELTYDELIAGRPDNGLLLMSRRPLLAAKVIEFDHDLCAGADCGRRKGFLHAEVLTDASETIRRSDPQQTCTEDPDTQIEECEDHPPPQGYSGSEALDIYCTHLQAGFPSGLNQNSIVAAVDQILSFENPNFQPRGPDFIRNEQFEIFTRYIDDSRNPNRPALVLGDMNVNGKNPANLRSPNGIYTEFGLDEFGPFDQNNNQTLYSRRYDLAIAEDQTTVFVSDPADLGYGTSLDSNSLGNLLPGLRPKKGVCVSVDATRTGRLDYALVLPAKTEFPTHAVVNGTATPYPGLPGTLVNPIGGGDLQVPWDGSIGTNNDTWPIGPPTNLGGECLSDHAALFVDLNVARLVDTPVWNPRHSHNLDFKVAAIEETAGGDCNGGPDYKGSLHGRYLPEPPVPESPFGEGTDQWQIFPDATNSFAMFGVHPGSNDPPQAFLTILDLTEKDGSGLALCRGNVTVDVSEFVGEENVQHQFEFNEGLLWTDEANGPGVMNQCDLNMQIPCSWTTQGTEGDDRALVTFKLLVDP